MSLNSRELLSSPHVSFNTQGFTQGYRGSGILLHITSLPSRFGVGDFGPAACQWIDSLASAGQSWWQILPINPPDRGNSPYTPLSTFACNPLLISPDLMVQDGLLTPEDLQSPDFSEQTVEYDRVIPFKQGMLKTVWDRFLKAAPRRFREAYSQFCDHQAFWLDDYALFIALREKFQGAYYVDWPTPLVHREKQAMMDYAEELSTEIAYLKFQQYIAFDQLRRLRKYAQSKGVRLFGDVPIFVSADSSDVWANPDLFLLDEGCRPVSVAGVPPDYFSETGQLWGNPVYRWSACKESQYAWWIARLTSVLQHHDAVRLDHFRGFVAAWHVPADAQTAETGQWVAGPGQDFFDTVRDALGCLPFVAEDLGTITDDVRLLLDSLQLPRMSVLQFAFDGDPHNAFLPHHCPENRVTYTGTHDNDTTQGWYADLGPTERDAFWNYCGRSAQSGQEVAWIMIQMAWESKAALAVAPLQDILGLDSVARMNIPGVPDGNWAWRFTPQQLTNEAMGRLGQLTEATARLPNFSTGN